jgi:hypothetical protein
MTTGEGKMYKIMVDNEVYYCNDYTWYTGHLLWIYECGVLNNDHTFNDPGEVSIEINGG